MTEINKHTPSLRFPEFLNDGEWATATMESIFEIKNGYTPSKSNPAYWEGGTLPWFRMEDIRKSGHILSDSIQHITPSAVKSAGLFPAYSIIVATTATIGEHALIIVESLANQQFTFLTKRKSFDNRIDMLYFHYFMFIIDEWCKQNTNAGGLLSVNMEAFKKLVIPYPASLSEQRKIAECFSSIDKQITATKSKLEQLKEHKRGLMQRLFPAKGKTVPELRFPEFQNDEEWEIKKLRDIATFTKGKGISKTDVAANGATPCIRYGELYTTYKETITDTSSYTDLPIMDLFLSKTNDVIIPSSGETKEDIATASCILKDGIAIGGDINIIRTSNNGIFLSYYLTYVKKNDIARIAQGVSIIHLYNEQLHDLVVELPSSLKEQQRIADCLLSIDNVIKSYEDKITALELHKRGLMQQLFPKL